MAGILGILWGVEFAAAGLWAPTVTSIALQESDLPVRVNCTGGHKLSTGNRVVISGSSGVTGLNAAWTITVVTATQFTLDGSGALTGTPAGSPVVALEALDISGVDATNPVIFVRCEGLTEDKQVILGLEDTVNNFSASVARYTLSFQGAEGGSEITKSIAARDFPMHRFGTTDAKLRLRCLAIDGSAAAKVSAWVAA